MSEYISSNIHSRTTIPIEEYKVVVLALNKSTKENKTLKENLEKTEKKLEKMEAAYDKCTQDISLLQQQKNPGCVVKGTGKKTQYRADSPIEYRIQRGGSKSKRIRHKRTNKRTRR